jgi:restriction endonuclease Mrr
MAVTSRRGLEGPRTPREAFYPLILTVLETMGGRGEVHTVLNGVHDLIAHRLTEADCEPLESDPLMTRWYKSANWARFEMVRQGLLKRDSPRGVWEITEAGRAYLREHAPDYPARE